MEASAGVHALLAILPELILGGAACAVFLIAPFVPPARRDGIGYFSLGALGLSGLSLIPLCGKNISAFHGMIVLDAYAVFFKGILLTAAILVILISFTYIKIEKIYRGEYYGLILFATMGMLFLPAASDLLSVYLSLELMSMSFYILAAFMRKDGRSLEAGLKYFLVGIFTSGLILYGIAFLYGATGTTHFGAIRATLLNRGEPFLSPTLLFAFALLVAGFGLKIAAVPFHMWAPDVYEGAPTPISAFLAVGSKLAAFSAMVRLFVFGLPFYNHEGWIPLWLVAALTMTLGNVAALVQTNFKRLLAYSSIAHAGYLLIGLFVRSESGIAAVLIHAVAYLFMTLGAFTLGILVCREDVRGDQISDLKGVGRAHPSIGIAFVVVALSLVGIPPTAGFIGKLFLFGAAIEGKFYGLAVLGVLNSALSLYYYFKVATILFTEEASPSLPLSLPPPLKIGLLAMSGATLAVGLYPEPLLQVVFSAIRPLF